MTQNTSLFTGRLARAARALVGASAAHTADAAGLSREQLREFEKGRAVLNSEQIAALQVALEGLGAVFLADGQGGRGHGVRLKFSEAKTRRVETWEDEGGLPADDDV